MNIFDWNQFLFYSVGKFSGRTSRLEIRKLLWECLFWRFQRVPIDQNEFKYPTHSFLFDDEYEPDRSIQGQGHRPSYSTLTTKLSSRQNYLTPKSSMGNNSLQPSNLSSAASTLFTCCGFTIDLSQKQPSSLYTRSTCDDLPTRRSLKTKKTQMSSSPTNNLSVQSSNDRTMKEQRSVCYRPNNSNRPITRRRAATVVHCSRKTSLPTMTTLESSLPQSFSKPKLHSSQEKFSSIVDLPSTNKDTYRATIYLNEPSIIIQTDRDELPLPASIIERCW